ncbi:metallophosphoesterase family protein [Methanobrevibacter sp.]|uniref:metallophosphoesterase family protein n=1 Tax=Methanobrevibacter sp. TaxID=66852 RepID=UPI0038677504
MLIGLISDTHITEKRGKLPDKVIRKFKSVDLIIHAGDITQQKVIDELETIAPVIAVLGNNDKLDLNETEVIRVENFKIAINHGTKYSNDFNKLFKLANDMNVNVLITGHTHMPHCEIIDDVLLINPGSSNRPIKSNASIAILDINNKNKVNEIEVNFIEL